MFSTLLLDISGNLATITLNRPDKRNAISTAMTAELQSALDEIEISHARVGILTGSGKAFSAGMDLEMLAAIAQQSPSENQEDARRWRAAAGSRHFAISHWLCRKRNSDTRK